MCWRDHFAVKESWQMFLRFRDHYYNATEVAKLFTRRRDLSLIRKSWRFVSHQQFTRDRSRKPASVRQASSSCGPLAPARAGTTSPSAWWRHKRVLTSQATNHLGCRNTSSAQLCATQRLDSWRSRSAGNPIVCRPTGMTAGWPLAVGTPLSLQHNATLIL